MIPAAVSLERRRAVRSEAGRGSTRIEGSERYAMQCNPSRTAKYCNALQLTQSPSRWSCLPCPEPLGPWACVSLRRELELSRPERRMPSDNVSMPRQG